MKFKAMVVSAVMALAGCGDSSSNNGLQSGVFTDSPVAGIYYETPTQSGLTDSAGRFTYRRGERVSFSLGGTLLGSAPAAAEVTPLDLVGVDSLDAAGTGDTKNRLINILLLLQSLDRDHNPDNGIDLTGLNEALDGDSLDLDLPLPELYEAGLRRIINQQAGFFQTPLEAQNHFMEAQGLSVSLQLPRRDFFDDDGDGTAERKVEYDYNPDGSLAQITYTDEKTPRLLGTALLAYDANGYPARLDYTHEASPSLSYIELSEYDSTGRLLQLSRLDDSDKPIGQVRNVYDATGNLVSSSSEWHAAVVTAVPLQTFLHFSPVAPRVDTSGPEFFAPAYVPITFSPYIDPGAWPFLLTDFNGAIDTGGEVVVGIAVNWTALNDTVYTYNEAGELVRKAQDWRFIAPDNGSTIIRVPEDYTVVETYEEGRRLSRTRTTGASVVEDRFDYADNGSLISCRRLQTGSPIREGSFEQLPGEIVYIGRSCLSVRKVAVTRDDSERITRLEREAVRLDSPVVHPGSDPGGNRQILEFDYSQGRVETYRWDRDADGSFDWVYRYQYNDDGLLLRREVQVEERAPQIQSRQYTTLTVESLRQPLNSSPQVFF
ncbi:hypothetical protein FKG94_16360 [Exilibacterium tricleocarpae]|uniref:RHS repeat protein n=1 Tax=Exilibacterium tricleocarpae TaxID=2591008 RepID=A0A545TAD5_9GAMM|nr:hypothetical protein [Exilibacterium tricleocarpae]TQV74179.1 hypothetical protein FKG94_16360 [Exilibacterium tricleocarpae]